MPILCNIAEIAKTKNLKPYEYFRFLLDEIAEHLYGREHDPNDRTFLNGLLLWSDKLPAVCKKKICSLLESILVPALSLLDYTKGKNQFKEIAIIKYTKTHQLYVRLAWEQK